MGEKARHDEESEGGSATSTSTGFGDFTDDPKKVVIIQVTVTGLFSMDIYQRQIFDLS